MKPTTTPADVHAEIRAAVLAAVSGALVATIRPDILRSADDRERAIARIAVTAIEMADAVVEALR